MQTELNIMIFWKVKNARRVTKFMWPLKLVPAKVRGQLILNSEIFTVPCNWITLAIVTRSRSCLMISLKAAACALSWTQSFLCNELGLKPSMHRALEQKLCYFTLFTITGEIKHLILPLIVLLFQGKTYLKICHLNKSMSFVLLQRNQCKIDILSEES